MPRRQYHGDNRGDTTPAPPALPARPLTRLTSGRSGPPLVSLLPGEGRAESSVRATLYGPGGLWWLGPMETLTLSGAVPRPSRALPRLQTRLSDDHSRRGRGGGRERASKREEEGEASEDALPARGRPRPAGTDSRILSVPHLHPRQVLLLTAGTSLGPGVQWNSRTRCLPDREGREGRAQRTLRPGSGSPGPARVSERACGRKEGTPALGDLRLVVT